MVLVRRINFQILGVKGLSDCCGRLAASIDKLMPTIVRSSCMVGDCVRLHNLSVHGLSKKEFVKRIAFAMFIFYHNGFVSFPEYRTELISTV